MWKLKMRRVLCFLALAGVGLCMPVDGNAVEEVKSESWFSMMTWFEKPDTICEDLDWREYSFKLAKELPAAGLFRDLKGTEKWETSGMDVVGDNV